jgi:starch-binding outer membrane protein, SusD/RagB family
MNKNFLKIYALFLGIFLFSACDKNIEVEPISNLDGSKGFQTRQDVDAGLIGSYNGLQSPNYMGLRHWALSEIYADNITHVGTFPSFAQFANRNLLGDNTEISNMWAQIYIAINRANSVIQYADGVNDPAFNKTNAIAEAKFLRAYNYFNLLTAYGGSESGYNKAGGLGVPLRLKPTLSAADAAPVRRATEEEVWQQILKDLDDAVAGLTANNGLGRANKNVATALRARVRLFRGEWAQAEADASAVIAVTTYALVPAASYSSIWLRKNTSEAIWELQFDVNNTNQVAFFYYPTGSGGRNEMSSSTSLRDAHEMGDVRKEVNYGLSPAAKTVKYTRVPGDDNVSLIRIAEMYLIRAEARARQDKLTESLEDLNKIRVRAGLAVSTAATQQALIDAIEKERRLEFAHEGHRWFDLRRYGKLGSGITDPRKARWPLPLNTEVLISGGAVEQNPGY